ncbi:stress protein [Streptomyces phage BRock]|uniref:Stress protein n=1 Tax=Streptomyces phage BRock TaxID=1913591 RepID=A0A1J0GW82_9CAUD|nr:stress protein [Streptomyces phage BRock]APC46436.1 stress protein [Streptomyces phage BRock]
MSTISMRKDTTETIRASRINVGAGWIAPKTKVKKFAGFKVGGGKQKEVDLDLIAVAEDFDGSPIRICWYSNPDAFEDGTLTSDGDNQTGVGAGDDETIRAKLSELPGNVRQITFMVTAFKEGASFQDIEGADLNVYDGVSNEKLLHMSVKLNERSNAVAVAVATRVDSNVWDITYINQYANISGTRDSVLDFANRVSNF